MPFSGALTIRMRSTARRSVRTALGAGIEFDVQRGPSAIAAIVGS